jgi:hypothetical protein
MRKTIIKKPLFILAILFAFSWVSFAGPHDFQINQFMKYCLNENESFTKERIGLTNYYIISVGKFEVGLGTTYTVQDSFIVSLNATNVSEVAIMDKAPEIEGLLSDRYAQMNMTYDSLYPASFETGQILALVLQFNDSRQPEEAQCKLWTGTDKLPCYDRDTCLKAAFSTPMGNQVASGVGWPFVDAIGSFKNNSDDINSNMSNLLQNIDRIESKSGNIEGLLTDLDGNLKSMQTASNNISQNGLFDNYVYSFCWPINFNRTSLITAKVYVKRISDRMSPLFSIPDQARAMADAGDKREEIRKHNEQEAAKKKITRSFWSKLSKEERNLLRLLSSETSPGPLFPLPLRSWKVTWE